ncbi:permease-like cell division protein FtsX [Paenibacillus aurantius]|uniref:Cell division protein FtsX n=1 Tax=Paenibacillus aurantius TaxID=2918900 RepID=A0AA96RF59_9BACL|nr:permease-like cell division protein FtsX [Paenibacillus aurantius]WJH36325.1 permease-like cell division protein FtsX [Paenibacillus sp. CC-CFT747]WNQ11622.1 permease-like cell division protein FtsX [Paenibacillus aurantius]
MKISTLSRHLREGGKNVIRNGWMTFASVSSISISLFILGLFMILSINVSYLSQQMESKVEIRVFLDSAVSQETRSSLQSTIQAMPEVDKLTYISKEEGLKTLKKQLGDSLEGLDGENNPLMDSFTVEVKDPQSISGTADQINALNEGKNPKPIIKVDYGRDTVEKLFKFTSVVRTIGLVLVGCLSLTAMFLISNTIKLTILARNREIKIMKLVGATNGFIRWPFFIEGALLGFTGAAIPVLLLTWGYWEVIHSGSVDLSMFMLQLKPFSQVAYWVIGLLMGIGLVIGVWGSTLSVRKFLKV